MKKLFIILFFCSPLFQAQSQDYIPFVVEGKVWNIEKVSTWVGWPDYGVVRTEKCELKGDTVIVGVTYKKYYEGGVTFTNGSDYTFETKGTFKMTKNVVIEHGARLCIKPSNINF